ncbi:hypothetical protein IWQ47_003453 [Aquimarina sp. EL_43]|uniref:hypothetical protein n=1 Tax=unclassified Aquimarina TaxID=2627091 RepID=UPI0018C95B13|nr:MULTISPECIES: hypothetical protein [unclassified Aquimarina]MBG6131805.1 hypothetical protein [Aquimarina sp. EL_35]MBG6149369.1 hypothetical protein [Aquimarina sp. EL_32]MBG6170368.1 hypothetical protein [Aquimarina sp. EL_43]
MRNIIEDQLTKDEKEKAKMLVTQLEAIFMDKLSALTERERQDYKAINEKNKLFVNKVWDYRQHSSVLSSPDVDWVEFEKDYNARVFTESLLGRIESLAYRLESTKILHDYDNYQDALNDYSYSQYSKGAGKPGFTEKVAELKQFFARTKSVPKTDETEE